MWKIRAFGHVFVIYVFLKVRVQLLTKLFPYCMLCLFGEMHKREAAFQLRKKPQRAICLSVF